MTSVVSSLQTDGHREYTNTAQQPQDDQKEVVGGRSFVLTSISVKMVTAERFLTISPGQLSAVIVYDVCTCVWGVGMGRIGCELTISLICESVICNVTLRALSVSSTGLRALE